MSFSPKKNRHTVCMLKGLGINKQYGHIARVALSVHDNTEIGYHTRRDRDIAITREEQIPGFIELGVKPTGVCLYIT